MFGSRKEFRYLECNDCHCLSLQNPPSDLSSFYPDDCYYSLADRPNFMRPKSTVRRWVKWLRDRTLCFDDNWLQRWVVKRFPNEDAIECRNLLRPTSVRSFKSRILDIGCGNGWHLFWLQNLGFTSLTGVDPYLKKDLQAGRVKIRASDLESLAGEYFDLIMMHHVFEHIEDHVKTMKLVHRLLNRTGDCIIRIPIVSAGPWKRYGLNWVEIDAPRHFILHSEHSLKLTAEQAGLSIECTNHESDPFSYIGSEMYRRGLSLYDATSQRNRDPASVFSRDELEELKSQSESDLEAGHAGRAAFYLKKQS